MKGNTRNCGELKIQSSVVFFDANGVNTVLNDLALKIIFKENSQIKKTFAALAVLGAFAGTVAAADATLYGVVDTGLAYKYEKATVNVLGESASVSDNTLQMESGINAGSRFGLKGVEDLGNGIKVGFKLENGFESDDGTMKFDDRLFGRMGGLGFATGTYDTVYAIGDSFDGGDVYAFGLQASDRYDNMLTYLSPKLAGVQATMQYSWVSLRTATKLSLKVISTPKYFALVTRYAYPLSQRTTVYCGAQLC